MSDTQETERKLAQLLLRLGSKDTVDRWTAQTELRRDPPVSVEILIPLLIRLARVRRQSPFLLVTGLLAASITLLGLLLIFDHLFGSISHLPVLLAGLISAALMVRRWKQMQGAADRSLQNFNDVRIVGPLLSALGREDREAQVMARELLLHLLPRLRSNHSVLLDPAQHALLLDLLQSGDEKLAVTALQALGQIGDSEDARYVRPLAEDNVGSPVTPSVREAAQNCLTEISGRQTRLRLHQNLLRVIDGAQTTSSPNSAQEARATQGEHP